jgi:tRNA(Ile)-lysidine synthetase-like protein
MKKKMRKDKRDILAISGGPDSVFLLTKYPEERSSPILGHINHGARGEESDEDQKFVERLGKGRGLTVEVFQGKTKKNSRIHPPAGFEQDARESRRTFLKQLKKRHGAESILLAHTADDQVETILMRFLKGAGISGLKGIPRKTVDGIVHPMLDTWRADILSYLQRNRIPYRIDKSNWDTRFERNWIRHVLIPMLEKRYGISVKKRIFTLGERFREIDEFLGQAGRRWIARNLRAGKEETRILIPRKKYSKLPSAVRKKILQILSFEHIGSSPNERLLESMDKLIAGTNSSGFLNIGKKRLLRCLYEQAIMEIEEVDGRGIATEKGKRSDLMMNGPGRYGIPDGKRVAPARAELPSEILWEEGGKIPEAGLKRLGKGERAAAFDGDEVSLPFFVRPLKAGDRLRPFGIEGEKKVKEILIGRKIPREERWGRPAVFDAKGEIVWIPGVARSVVAPVTAGVRRTIILRGVFPDSTRQ